MNKTGKALLTDATIQIPKFWDFSFLTDYFSYKSMRKKCPQGVVIYDLRPKRDNLNKISRRPQGKCVNHKSKTLGLLDFDKIFSIYPTESDTSLLNQVTPQGQLSVTPVACFQQT